MRQPVSARQAGPRPAPPATGHECGGRLPAAMPATWRRGPVRRPGEGPARATHRGSPGLRPWGRGRPSDPGAGDSSEKPQGQCSPAQTSGGRALRQGVCAPSVHGAVGPSEPSPSPGPAGKQRPVSPPTPGWLENHVWQLPSGCRTTGTTWPPAPYSHGDLAQTAEPVIDDMRLLRPVEKGHRLEVVFLEPDAGFRRVDGNCHQVDDKVQKETSTSHLWVLCQGMSCEVSRPCPRPGAVGPASGRDGGRSLMHPAAALAPQRDEAGGGSGCRRSPKPHEGGGQARGAGGHQATR